MSMIEDMTKEMQYIRDKHQNHLDQIKDKGASTNVPTDNKFEIYQQISYGYNVKGVNYGSQIIIFLVI